MYDKCVSTGDAPQKRIENVLILRLRKHEEAAMQCRYVPAFKLTVTKEDRTIQEPYYRFLCDFRKWHIISDKQRHVNHQMHVSLSLALILGLQNCHELTTAGRCFSAPHATSGPHDRRTACTQG
jgi:hypothetical protein